MVKDEDLFALSTPQYWNERYSASRKPDGEGDGQENENEIESYEWYRTFEKLKYFFNKHLPELPAGAGCHILHLGCGHSTLTYKLHSLGYTNQTSIDFSPIVIDAMLKKYASLDTHWAVMDVRSLTLPSASIDMAIDKATLDAFIHGSVWDPPDDVKESVGKYVDEVFRVLKPGGRWLYVTYQQPRFMKGFLERSGWGVEVEVLVDPEGAGGFDYFGFVMSKDGDWDGEKGEEVKKLD